MLRQDDHHIDYYLAFVSIIFGIYVTEWARPIGEVLRNGNLDALKGVMLGGEAWLKIIQCVLTLCVIVCLWWWYGFILGRYDPAKGLSMYAFDFLSLGCFAVASGIWMNLAIFPAIVLVACLLIFMRFLIAHRRVKKVPKLRIALTWALTVLGVSILLLSVATIAFYVGIRAGGEKGVTVTQLSILNFVIMSLSVVVTLVAAYKIEGIGWSKTFPFKLSTVESNKLRLASEDRPAGRPEFDVVGVRMRCQLGEHEFRQRLIEANQHTGCCMSQVHSEHDLRCQAFLPAVASLRDLEEIISKSELMYFVHWFDDLVDQKEVSGIKRILASNETEGVKLSRLAQTLTARAPIKQITEAMRNLYATTLGRDFFNMGMQRVALGSHMFSQGEHARVSRELHRHLLRSKAAAETVALVNERFVDLSVKTVQEFWFGIESPVLSFDYSLLFSFLYGPALYYHNWTEEEKRAEFSQAWGVLAENDVVAMIKTVGAKINEMKASDNRFDLRASEIRAVAHTFEIVLPKRVKAAYEQVADALVKPA